MSRPFYLCFVGTNMNSEQRLTQTTLSHELTVEILSQLGLKKKPKADLGGLEEIYSAWCHHVPFDNIQKLLHLKSQSPLPLPGDDPTDFFQQWIKVGTGGTCWACSTALYSLLKTHGFKVYLGAATMLVAPNLPPNHGTIIVDIEGKHFLVDSSMMHDSPLRLDTNATTIQHQAWGLNGTLRDMKWQFHWRPLHMLSGCVCRLDEIDVSAQYFRRCHEQTRVWGPFNYSVYTRINRSNCVTGLAYGYKIDIDSLGNIKRKPIDRTERNRFLIEEMGISDELVANLPLDKPLPHPPE